MSHPLCQAPQKAGDCPSDEVMTTGVDGEQEDPERRWDREDMHRLRRLVSATYFVIEDMREVCHCGQRIHDVHEQDPVDGIRARRNLCSTWR